MEFVQNSIKLFEAGGPVMYPLLLCSIIALTVGIERLLYFRSNCIDLLQLADKAKAGLKNDDIHQAVADCQGGKGSMAEAFVTALQTSDSDAGHLQQALESGAVLVVARLRERLHYLDTIVTLAPLLGLLGTVIGMIKSFSVMAVRTGQPHAITGGVGESLIATAFGLCVAIAALVIHSYFTQRIETAITDFEQAGSLVIAQLKRGDSHEA